MDRNTYRQKMYEARHNYYERSSNERSYYYHKRDLERARRKLEHDKAVLIAKNKARSSALARGIGGVGHRFLSSVNQGANFKTVIVFFALFVMISQIFMNPGLLTGRFTIQGYTYGVYDEDGFLSEQFLDKQFDPYNFFYSYWENVSSVGRVNTSAITWALNNYTVISNYFDQENVTVVDGGSLGFWDTVSFFWTSGGLLSDIVKAVNRVGDVVRRIVQILAMIGNTIVLLVALIYSAFSSVLVILGIFSPHSVFNSY